MQNKIKAALIFSCSARKSCAAVISHESLGDNLLLSEAAHQWLKLLHENKSKAVAAEKFYTGSGMNSIAKIRMELKNPHNVHIVSNGSGLTSIIEGVVPYHFTTDEPDDPSNIHTHLREKFQKSIWWSLINKDWHNDETPLATMLQNPKNDYVIIALYKRHLRYIVEDILTIETQPEMSKLRIIVLGGNRSSLPVRLHKYCLCYKKKFLDQQLGNRNDVPHRAAQHCIKYLKEHSDTSIEQQQSDLQKAQEAYLGKPIEKTLFNYVTLFEDRPELLDFETPDEAYTFSKVTGHLAEFRIAWVGAKGLTSSADINMDAANAALGAIEGSLQRLNKTVKHVSWEVELDAITSISTFVQLLREKSIATVFDAKTLFHWLEMFYSSRPEAQQKLPDMIDTIGKVRKMLDIHASPLSIEKYHPENSSKILYKLIS